ncbi:hypothetical protein C5C86_03175 [Rathayibacter sp. AY1E4]|uniref:hypothetical protein n=1 Tax=Rathayibacter sp. AY1E4 TaxID=2080552 RepID=UPI000CE91C2B|nr:hypothetical protein [Rathayibacter sp. AY1E4]PPH42895.1 hypothetical protein C5C86_03175 [Rathayibacter sp. AY1E4]
MEREVAAAERQRRKVARVSKVRGKHFTEHVDEIQALRRAEQYDEALELLFECIAAAEEADEIEGNGRATAYTEWAAMTFRKQKRYAEEVAVIERFFTGQKNPARANHPKLMDRLAKARDLRDAALTADALPACPSCGSVLDVVPKTRGKCESSSCSACLSDVHWRLANEATLKYQDNEDWFHFAEMGEGMRSGST